MKNLIELIETNSKLKTEAEFLTNHKNNLTQQYNQIVNTRAFKLWQLFNKIKKSPKLIKKGLIVFFKKGPNGPINRLKSNQLITNKIIDINGQYQIWLKQNWPKPNELKKQKQLQIKFHYRPKISIITPVYNPKPLWLKKCIKSVINQSYDNWELCLADDASTKPHVRQILEKYRKKDKRIKVTYRKKNGHISKASNSALKLTTGKFVALLDHDDELSPNALYEVIKTLNIHPKADLIYSDEDKLELSGTHVDPFFKPDWSPDMLMSTNYICHFCVIRKKLVSKVGGFKPGYEGSQDYDLFLRITELSKNIYHIPKILYSWRKVPGSTATVYTVKNYANQASIMALSDSLVRQKIQGNVQNGIAEGTFRVNYKIIDNPLVSIIIPTKDKINYLKKCISSILKNTTYQNFHINIVDTGSLEDKTKKYYQKIKTNSRITILKWQRKFNFSSVNNFAVKKVKGEYVLLLNNDIEVISKNWLTSMLEQAQRNEIGAVGAKLLYPNYQIQHAGIILGIKGGPIKKGVAGHSQKLFSDEPSGLALWNSKDIIRDFSAVTAACLLIKRSKYIEVGGMDERFRVAFNDVDFCLKLQKAGYLNVYTPYAKLFHHESISVGTPQKGNRNLEEFSKETNLMHKKWGNLLQNDPYYNKNLSLKNEKCEINNNI